MRKWFNPRYLLLLVILLLAGALVFQVLRQEDQPPPAEDAAPPEQGVDLALEKVTYTETVDGERRWTIQADSAGHRLEQELTRLQNVRMVFFRADDPRQVTVSALEGEMDGDRREVRLRGGVDVATPEGHAFRTEKLLYRDAERAIVSDGAVKISSPGMEVEGTGMRYDLERGTFEVFSDVKARMTAIPLQDRK